MRGRKLKALIQSILIQAANDSKNNTNLHKRDRAARFLKSDIARELFDSIKTHTMRRIAVKSQKGRMVEIA